MFGSERPKPRSSVKKQVYYCQVDGCSSKLSNCKAYCVRYRVCQQHLAAPSVPLQGIDHRFCQQCGRFQELSEFDGTKRSCRTRLAHHNNIRQQRRKEAATAQLLANSVLDLPRSSRPSAARTPGTFGLLLNSPEHAPEYTEPPSSRNSAGRGVSATAARGRLSHEQHAGGIRTQLAAGRQVHEGSAQHAGRGSNSVKVGGGRWTEATAAEFFTSKASKRASEAREQPRQPQQPQQMVYGCSEQHQHLQLQQQQQHHLQQPHQQLHMWGPSTAAAGLHMMSPAAAVAVTLPMSHAGTGPLMSHHADAYSQPMGLLQQPIAGPGLLSLEAASAGMHMQHYSQRQLQDTPNMQLLNPAQVGGGLSRADASNHAFSSSYPIMQPGLPLPPHVAGGSSLVQHTAPPPMSSAQTGVNMSTDMNMYGMYSTAGVSTGLMHTLQTPQLGGDAAAGSKQTGGVSTPLSSSAGASVITAYVQDDSSSPSTGSGGMPAAAAAGGGGGVGGATAPGCGMHQTQYQHQVAVLGGAQGGQQQQQAYAVPSVQGTCTDRGTADTSPPALAAGAGSLPAMFASQRTHSTSSSSSTFHSQLHLSPLALSASLAHQQEGGGAAAVSPRSRLGAKHCMASVTSTAPPPAGAAAGGDSAGSGGGGNFVAGYVSPSSYLRAEAVVVAATAAAGAGAGAGTSTMPPPPAMTATHLWRDDAHPVLPLAPRAPVGQHTMLKKEQVQHQLSDPMLITPRPPPRQHAEPTPQQQLQQQLSDPMLITPRPPRDTPSGLQAAPKSTGALTGGLSSEGGREGVVGGLLSRWSSGGGGFDLHAYASTPLLTGWHALEPSSGGGAAGGLFGPIGSPRGMRGSETLARTAQAGAADTTPAADGAEPAARAASEGAEPATARPPADQQPQSAPQSSTELQQAVKVCNPEQEQPKRGDSQGIAGDAPAVLALPAAAGAAGGELPAAYTAQLAHSASVVVNHPGQQPQHTSDGPGTDKQEAVVPQDTSTRREVEARPAGGLHAAAAGGAPGDLWSDLDAVSMLGPSHSAHVADLMQWAARGADISDCW